MLFESDAALLKYIQDKHPDWQVGEDGGWGGEERREEGVLLCLWFGMLGSNLVLGPLMSPVTIKATTIATTTISASTDTILHTFSLLFLLLPTGGGQQYPFWENR